MKIRQNTMTITVLPKNKGVMPQIAIYVHYRQPHFDTVCVLLQVNSDITGINSYKTYYY